MINFYDHDNADAIFQSAHNAPITHTVTPEPSKLTAQCFAKRTRVSRSRYPRVKIIYNFIRRRWSQVPKLAFTLPTSIGAVRANLVRVEFQSDLHGVRSYGRRAFRDGRVASAVRELRRP